MKKAIFLAASIFTLFCGVALAQTPNTGVQKLTVSGTVLDAATNKPIAGANIEVPGVASAITDDNGHYIITLPRAEGIMNAIASGYGKREFSVSGRTAIDILL